VQFQEKFLDNHLQHSDQAEFAGLLNFIGEIGDDAEERLSKISLSRPFEVRPAHTCYFS
jgi:hypothetical protein